MRVVRETKTRYTDALRKFVTGDELTVKDCVDYWEMYCWKGGFHQALWEMRYYECKKQMQKMQP